MKTTTDWNQKAEAALAARPKCSKCLCVLRGGDEKLRGTCMQCNQDAEDEKAKIGRRAYEARSDAASQEKCSVCDVTLHDGDMEDGICLQCATESYCGR